MFRENFQQKLISLLKSNFQFNFLKNQDSREEFLKTDGSRPSRIAFWILDDPTCYKSEKFAELFDNIIRLVADETFLLYKKRKSISNKSYRVFKNSVIKFQKDPDNNKLNNFIKARTELNEILQKSTNLHAEQKRLYWLKKSTGKAGNFYNLIGKNYRTKTFDPKNQTDYPTFTFPHNLQALLNEYNVSINDIFTQSLEGSHKHIFTLVEIQKVLKNTKANSAL